MTHLDNSPRLDLALFIKIQIAITFAFLPVALNFIGHQYWALILFAASLLETLVVVALMLYDGLKVLSRKQRRKRLIRHAAVFMAILSLISFLCIPFALYFISSIELMPQDQVSLIPNMTISIVIIAFFFWALGDVFASPEYEFRLKRSR